VRWSRKRKPWIKSLVINELQSLRYDIVSTLHWYGHFGLSSEKDPEGSFGETALHQKSNKKE
jgi:hypothetical protein